jgi:hypothetical protein
MSATPSILLPMAEDAAPVRVVEDVNFQNLLYWWDWKII